MTKGAPSTVLASAAAVLRAAAPTEKSALAHAALAAASDPSIEIGEFVPGAAPDRPARPDRPILASPGKTPRRRLGGSAGRIALLHAIAHIEFNAIDLAFDMAVRFSPEIKKMGLDAPQFIRDWIGVGADEARHFGLLSDRLGAFGTSYGDLPAHDGLWEAADNTKHSALARLAIAPLILEARGLDVTPDMIVRLEKAGDSDSADILKIIYEEEVSHVACGNRWFQATCNVLGLAPADTFDDLKSTYFKGGLKPPFNHKARDLAGIPRSFYERN